VTGHVKKHVVAKLDREHLPAAARREIETVSSPIPASFESAAIPSVTPGEFLAGRYLVEAELGRGGAGAVYRAFDHGAEMRVAIKMLNPHRWSGPQSAEQLYRELRFGRSIQHLNVCRIYDVFEAQGRCFLVMEYAGRGTLRTTLRELGANRPLDEKLEDARAVIEGLSAIHRAGLVHRDLKPENILRMADGRLVVSDFGVTRALEQTTADDIAGTPGYFAPETLVDGKTTQASDVWSLGVVLHEILAGRRPDWAVSRAPAAFPLEAGADRRWSALALVCNACLHLKADRRPKTAIQVGALLEEGFRRLFSARWGLAAALARSVIAIFMGGALFGSDVASSQRSAAGLLATGADWSNSRVLLARRQAFCVEALPGNSGTVRAAGYDEWRTEVEPMSGRVTPVAGPSDNIGCPAVSPDGRSLLFSRLRDGRSTRLMYSASPDGKDAVPLMEGSEASWLPSGKEFLFVTPAQRVAVGTLRGETAPFSRSGPTPWRVYDVVSDDRGEMAAAVLLYRIPVYESWIEIYDIRSMKQVRSFAVPGIRTLHVKFDRLRRSFQFSELRGEMNVWVELTTGGDRNILGSMTDRHVTSAVHTAAGYVLTTYPKVSGNPLWLTRGDGSQRLIHPHVREFKTSSGGDVVYVATDEHDRRQVQLLRAGSSPEMLSEPGFFHGPGISSDGRSIIYYQAGTSEMFHCDSSAAKSRCATVWKDPGLALSTGMRISPDGDKVAYIASDTPEHTNKYVLRLLSLRQRRAQDLMPIEGKCYPMCELHWTGNDSLRWCTSDGSWSEIKIPGGEITRGQGVDACRPPPQNPDHRYELRDQPLFDLRFAPEGAGWGGGP
jgi:tRNA A-37 threonylcarbamoyl transferase component Bud32